MGRPSARLATHAVEAGAVVFDRPRRRSGDCSRARPWSVLETYKTLQSTSAETLCTLLRHSGCPPESHRRTAMPLVAPPNGKLNGLAATLTSASDAELANCRHPPRPHSGAAPCRTAGRTPRRSRALRHRPAVLCHLRHLVGQFRREFRTGEHRAGVLRRLRAPRRPHPAL